MADILAELLTLTNDAVIVFDDSGRITLANEEAVHLVGSDAQTLVGLDIRLLLPPALGSAPTTAFDPAFLPFTLDGSTTHLTVLGKNGRPLDLALRCTRLDHVSSAVNSAPNITTSPASYLMLFAPQDSDITAQREHDRLLDELARANRRLSGTLEVVLSTIDSGDVGVLFSRTMEQLKNTMEATSAVLYLLEEDSFRLRGWSQDADLDHMPQHLSFDNLRAGSIADSTEALCLRLLPPTREELRAGNLMCRTMLDERTRESFQVPLSEVPPFTSMLAAPIWFAGHPIAGVVVGWQHAHQLSREDARLLGAVGRYLSTQLAGAVATLRQQRSMELVNASSRLRELLLQIDAEYFQASGKGSLDIDDTSVESQRNLDHALSTQTITSSHDFLQVCEIIAHTLNCLCTLAWDSVLVPPTCVIARQGQNDCELALPLKDYIDPEGAPTIITATSKFSQALLSEGLPSYGAVVPLVDLGERSVALLALRGADDDAFDDLELAFLSRLGDDVRDISHAGKLRAGDRQISQALQTGMRNELQKVDGLSAQGLYSSATQAAFVGGDFYDLIRLPNHRACVIMGDVSGKGVEAASVSAAVKTALGAYSWEGLRPARMVALLNEFLLGFSRIETFATLFVGIIDTSTGELIYCSAGHPPAIIARADSSELVLCNVQSGVVGAFSEMTYRNGRIKLASGDILVLYTDGTTEARAIDGSFYGEEGLRESLLRELPAGFDHLLDRLLATLDEFTSRNLNDDVAMVALRFDGLS